MNRRISPRLSLLWVVVLACVCIRQPLNGGDRPLVDEAMPQLVEVFVVDHGWHTGIIIAGGRLEQRLPDIARDFSTAHYYELGWGDADFYQSGETNFFDIIRALFWPGNSVMHVVAVAEHPKIQFRNSHVRAVSFNAADFERLLDYIDRSFDKGTHGKIQRIGPGLYGSSYFYKATGQYHLFNTCNTWTAKALVSAGMDINEYEIVTSKEIMAWLTENPT